MILALSGRIKAGKSTVANIIQLLIGRDKLQHEHPNTIFENMLNPNSINSYSKEELEGMSNWKQVAFAAKLKQIVALLIGCTVEQLEDQEFKNTPLSEEWWYYLTPKGKIDYQEYEKLRPLVFMEMEVTLVKLTPRLLLQLLGTDCGRNILHPNIWINALFANYNTEGFDYTGCEGKEIKGSWTYPKWVITDMRFPNEMEAVKNRGGITIRVNRPKATESIGMDIIDMENNQVVKSYRKSEHESETALDNAEFDYVIDNNSDIHHLIEEVRKMLIHFKII